MNPVDLVLSGIIFFLAIHVIITEIRLRKISSKLDKMLKATEKSDQQKLDKLKADKMKRTQPIIAVDSAPLDD